ncbi:aspartate:proton symporter, partial [Corynebacterium propinquum]
VKGMAVLGPLSFIIAALIVYWSGWSTVSWLLGLQILMFAVYLLCVRWVPTAHLNLQQQVRSSAWLIGFYAVTILLSKLGSFGGIGVLSHPFDTLVVAACALGIYYWGAATGVPAHLVRLENEDDESEAVSAPHYSAPLSPATP